jgi:hypothetical protein
MGKIKQKKAESESSSEEENYFGKRKDLPFKKAL